MTNIRNSLMQAAGTAASGDPVYVEDVFSVDLSVGTGSNITVNNGIDLSGEDGLVIWRRRDGAENWNTQDTVRGVNSIMYTDSSNAAADPGSYGLDSFNSNGFTAEANAMVNAGKFCSWTFRKQKGFFDIVTYTGNGTAGREISHNLGSTPGMIAVKALGRSENWLVYHANLSDPDTKILGFNLANGEMNQSTPANLHSATATKFEVGNDTSCNNNGDSYIAYLWASGNDSASQIFGDDGDEAIIKTGSYTADSSNAYAVNLGFEPQWLMIKRTSGTGDWEILDNMRGVTFQPADGQFLEANNSNAEFNDYGAYITSTGFVGSNQSGANGASYIYIAIRRGPMKEPSAGTDVFMADRAPNTSPAFVSGFPVDFGYSIQGTAGGGTTYFTSRLTGTALLNPTSTATAANNNSYTVDFQNGMYDNTSYANAGGTLYTIGHMWRRYPKVFDVVVYEGNGSNSPFRTINHNLGVAPELVIIKNIDQSLHWGVNQNTGDSDVDGDVLYLNLDGAYSGADGLTASATTVTLNGGWGGTAQTNGSGDTHFMLMFASLDGISKVGAYTGTGNDLNVTGLNAAARFVLIKRTDASGDWYVFDSVEQGIVAGNDTFQYWNTSGSAATTDQDYIDPHSSGFTITSSAPAALNASGGKYLYLAFS